MSHDIVNGFFMVWSFIMALSTRNKMIAGTMELIRRRGLNATSVREVVRFTDTPRGSIKHHFPNGKLQLVIEAVQLGGDEVSKPLKAVMEQNSSIEGLALFIGWWRKILNDTEYQAGCPILAVASEQYIGEDGNPSDEAEEQLLVLVDKIFKDWQKILVEALCRDGLNQQRATGLADLIIASIEGTVAICRAARSTSSLDNVEQELKIILKMALDSAQP